MHFAHAVRLLIPLIGTDLQLHDGMYRHIPHNMRDIAQKPSETFRPLRIGKVAHRIHTRQNHFSGIGVVHLIGPVQGRTNKFQIGIVGAHRSKVAEPSVVEKGRFGGFGEPLRLVQRFGGGQKTHKRQMCIGTGHSLLPCVQKNAEPRRAGPLPTGLAGTVADKNMAANIIIWVIPALQYRYPEIPRRFKCTSRIRNDVFSFKNGWLHKRRAPCPSVMENTGLGLKAKKFTLRRGCALPSWPDRVDDPPRRRSRPWVGSTPRNRRRN